MGSSPRSERDKMTDISNDEPMPEQTDNSPRPEDGEQPDEIFQAPIPRTDLVEE